MVELMIATVIIGLLASLAVPGFARMRMHAQNTRISNDLRMFSDGFLIYNFVTGNWPETQAPAELPPDMPEDFKVEAWRLTFPLGGNWRWVHEPERRGIEIVNIRADSTRIRNLDQRVDDGDLAAGRMLLVETDTLFYRVD